MVEKCVEVCNFVSRSYEGVTKGILDFRSGFNENELQKDLLNSKKNILFSLRDTFKYVSGKIGSLYDWNSDRNY